MPKQVDKLEKVVKYTNPFCPNGVETKGVDTGDTQYHYFKRVKKVIYAVDGDPSSEVIDVRDVLVKDKDVDIQEYINSFANEVGPKAVIKKMMLGVDVNLNQKPSLNNGDAIFPAGQMPESYGDAMQRMDQADKLWDSVPKDLKDGKSIEDFLKNITEDDITKYFDAKKKALLDAKKEVIKDGE